LKSVPILPKKKRDGIRPMD